MSSDRTTSERDLYDADERGVIRQLEAYAASTAQGPSDTLVERVMLAVATARRPRRLTIAVSGLRTLLGSAARGLRRTATTARDGALPRIVRLQAAATLVVAMLLVTAGAAIAVGGASSAFQWVSEPHRVSPPAIIVGPSLTPAPETIEPRRSPTPSSKVMPSPERSPGPSNDGATDGSANPTATIGPNEATPTSGPDQDGAGPTEPTSGSTDSGQSGSPYDTSPNP